MKIGFDLALKKKINQNKKGVKKKVLLLQWVNPMWKLI